MPLRILLTPDGTHAAVADVTGPPIAQRGWRPAGPPLAGDLVRPGEVYAGVPYARWREHAGASVAVAALRSPVPAPAPGPAGAHPGPPAGPPCPRCGAPMQSGRVALEQTFWTALFAGFSLLTLYFRPAGGGGRERVLGSWSGHDAARCGTCGTTAIFGAA